MVLCGGSALRVAGGVRIGEASHPGPPKSSRGRSRPRDISLAGIHLPASDAESDDEVPGPSPPGLGSSGSPDESRNVAPRVDHGEPREGFLWIPKRLRLSPQSREDDLLTANRFAVLRANRRGPSPGSERVLGSRTCA